MSREIFRKQSVINAPVDAVFKWHARPGAIERLSPPWDPLKVLYRSGGIEKGAQVVLLMKAGPVPYKWHARHTDYRENELFRDEQIRGPFSAWVHTHRFEPASGNQCILEDVIEYRLPLHAVSALAARRMIRSKLQRIFSYRHDITARDIGRHHSDQPATPLTVLISGASGVIGSAVIPFLTTGGHRVIRLVRRPPEPGSDEVFWDPASGVIRLEGIDRIDAVLHLAGENLDNGRWTPSRKKKILESRVKGTELIARAISTLDEPPGVMLCASAVGFYGNRGGAMLSETDGPGDDFISSVCDRWEKAAAPAAKKGIRTAFLRIGVVLTPMGGALQKVLLPYRLGLGGRIGSGRQYISWISMEDVIGSIHHILTHKEIAGPVNIVSPEPVTNRDYTGVLGRVLGRPTPLTLPSFVIKAGFGQMGREILLSSTRVMPDVLIKTGYGFVNSDLEMSLRHTLGKRGL